MGANLIIITILVLGVLSWTRGVHGFVEVEGKLAI